MYFSRMFLPLLDLMIDHLRRLAHDDRDQTIKLSSLSYNVIMTESYIHVVPRTAEKFALSDELKISINSLGFAGMILVKSEEALDRVKEAGPLNVLRQVAFRPVAAGESTDEIIRGTGSEGVNR